MLNKGVGSPENTVNGGVVAFALISNSEYYFSYRTKNNINLLFLKATDNVISVF